MEKKFRWVQEVEKMEQKDNWFILLFAKPNLYLYNLLKRTAIMGLVLFAIYEAGKYLGITSQAIPTTWHSVVGIVIGLLLVFRTNTAYDRWWEARKTFSAIESSFIILRATISGINKTSQESKDKLVGLLQEINNCIFVFVAEDDKEKSVNLKKEFSNKILQFKNVTSKLLASGTMTPQDYTMADKKIADIVDCFCTLERIKETPIPISYSLHIKISLFAYLLSLPFGLFYDLGLWSVPMVMILFFIIAGIEIISNEIENPFKGDPNDLPIDEFKKQYEDYINSGQK